MKRWLKEWLFAIGKPIHNRLLRSGIAIQIVGKDVPKSLADFAQAIVPLSSPVLVDVGANTGQSIEQYRQIFDRPQIHSFEPDPACYETLVQKYGNETGIHLNKCACGQNAGSRTLYVNTRSLLNSLREPNKDSSDYRGDFEKEVIVPIIRLDDYLSDQGIDKVDYLKIDTQGFERETLLGAKDALANKVSCLQIEVFFSDFYGQPDSFREIEAIIGPYGFKLYTLFDYKYFDCYRISHVDAVYVRNL